jgi:XTP/dITP diphosphohydrolase
MQLVIASHNVHKIREFRAMLKPFKHLDVLSLIDFPHYIAPEETGSTFEENAIAKAVDAAKALNCWAIGDDSGLMVPALNGAPSVYSRRYAGPHATDKDNRIKLLNEMRTIDPPFRQGVFECCIALASPEGLKKCVKGTVEGMITTEDRGNLGFGYDSLFIKYEYGKTFAELEEETKNRISHRRKAFDKLIPLLESLE